MYSKVTWVLVPSGIQVWPQIFDPDYLPDYFSVSYEYVSYNRYRADIKRSKNKNIAVLARLD